MDPMDMEKSIGIYGVHWIHWTNGISIGHLTTVSNMNFLMTQSLISIDLMRLVGLLSLR